MVAPFLIEDSVAVFFLDGESVIDGVSGGLYDGSSDGDILPRRLGNPLGKDLSKKWIGLSSPAY